MIKKDLLKLVNNLQKLTLSLGIITLALTGCGEVTQRQVHTIPATVMKVQYRDAFKTPYYNVSTETWTYIHHPEDYSTFIKCTGTIYNLDSKEAYILCKDKVKEEILVNYIMLYYEDGKIETYVEVGGYR